MCFLFCWDQMSFKYTETVKMFLFSFFLLAFLLALSFALKKPESIKQTKRRKKTWKKKNPQSIVIITNGGGWWRKKRKTPAKHFTEESKNNWMDRKDPINFLFCVFLYPHSKNIFSFSRGGGGGKSQKIKNIGVRSQIEVERKDDFLLPKAVTEETTRFVITELPLPHSSLPKTQFFFFLAVKIILWRSTLLFFSTKWWRIQKCQKP